MLDLRPNCELCDTDLPPDTRRRQLKYSPAEVAELSARLRDTPPAQR